MKYGEFTTDIKNMVKFKDIIPVFLSVMKEPIVLFTLAGFLLVIFIASGIANYRKRPPKKRKKKGTPEPVVVQAPEPQEEEPESEE